MNGDGARPFWETKSLKDMSVGEWESLCDGCGKCCLLKLEDEDTGDIAFTDIACRLLDPGQCLCTDYANRQKKVPDCIILKPENIAALKWMPKSCAYRLLSEGKKLEWWHPLLSGDPETVHQAGISVRGRTVPEQRGDDPEDRIVTWAE